MLLQGFIWARIVLVSRKRGSINKETMLMNPWFICFLAFFFFVLIELKRQ